MKALAIDSSNLVMGIAVIDDGTVIGEYVTNLKRNHSVRLMPAIEQLMDEVGVKPKELDRMIVAHGPGSYTGVRIGVSIAKTLAWTLNIPIVGVSSLEVLAQNGFYFPGYVSPLFDARRGQVYTGLYQLNGEDNRLVEAERIIMLDEWLNQLQKQDQPVLFIGNDVALHKTLIEEKLGEQAVFAEGSSHNPRPSALAGLGIKKEAQAVHEFVPNYLRLAEAEANWLAAQQKQG